MATDTPVTNASMANSLNPIFRRIGGAHNALVGRVTLLVIWNIILTVLIVIK